MLRVGLTGGIGSGKSTVARRFAELGAVIIDSDVLAREVVEPGTKGLAELVAVFGQGILTETGSLDRSALAAKAFLDAEMRQQLNQILHPKIALRTAELMSQAPSDAIVVHDIPLLVENDLSARYHLTVVVDAALEVRLQRLVQSRGMTESDAQSRIQAQATEEQRRAVADVWLDNTGEPAEVLSEVDKLWTDRLIPFEANIRLRRPRPSRPVAIVPFDDAWLDQADRAIARLRFVGGDSVSRIDHIGATAVPGMAAQDVIDLQLVTSVAAESDLLMDSLANVGFLLADTAQLDGPLVLYGADPVRPVNLMIRMLESPSWRRVLLFRDWLHAHAEERTKYSELRQRLSNDYMADASVYAEKKQAWIEEALIRAEKWASQTGWTPPNS